MSELGGLDIFSAEEGAGAPSEKLSEEAKERFSASAKVMKQLRKAEKRAKKKDDQVARTIIQFLNDSQHTRFFILISKLVGRNCPSIFILGILSLVNDDCLKVVQDYFKENEEPNAQDTVDASMALIDGADLKKETNRKLIDWITRLQMILVHEAERVLESLMIDDTHLDGSVLQLTTFVLQEFFEKKEKKELPYEKAQPLTASVLQTVLEPFLHRIQKKVLPSPEDNEDEDDD